MECLDERNNHFSNIELHVCKQRLKRFSVCSDIIYYSIVELINCFAISVINLLYSFYASNHQSPFLGAKHHPRRHRRS